jgi:hypothetical protein
MRTSGRSESEAQQAARPVLLRPGWYDGECREAAEGPSKNGNDRIEVVFVVSEREFRDYLTDVGRGGLKLRHACAAVGALAKYEAGEIAAADFPGHVCRLRIGVEKRRGWPDRNVIEDYMPADTAVVPLRSAS